MRVDRPQLQLNMPAQLLPAAHHTWLESCKNVRISALHRDVARVLTEHGIPHNIEHVTEDELFSVDIALPGESSSSARTRNFARLAFATNCIIAYFTGISACARAFNDICFPGVGASAQNNTTARIASRKFHHCVLCCGQCMHVRDSSMTGHLVCPES